MTTVQIHIDSSTALRSIRGLERALDVDSLTAFLQREAAPFLQRRATARFAEEGDEASGPWAPLLATTESWRAGWGFPASNPINIRTGTLRDWVTNNAGVSENTTHLARLNWPGSPSGWTEVKYKAAQKGKSRPKTEPRPVVAADETDLTFMLSGIAHWVAARSDVELV